LPRRISTRSFRQIFLAKGLEPGDESGHGDLAAAGRADNGDRGGEGDAVEDGAPGLVGEVDLAEFDMAVEVRAGSPRADRSTRVR
jgi:hypothetical protein